jgi:Ca2+-binding EF-hand superfamily protein
MMRKMKLIASRFICAVYAVLLTPLVSYANDASRNQEIAERFAKCDVNKDGKLTLDEAKGCMPRIYSNFSYIDSGNKGYVTVAEIQAIADR